MPTAALLVATALALAASLAAALALAAAPAAAAWRLPVRGEVVRSFTYDERRPFAAGSRRGVDIAGAPGAAVRAACSGRISHAGPVPQRGLSVSVRCDHLTATHVGLGALTVRRGDRVRRGQRLGRVGPSGALRLGARITTRRFGWIDPVALVEGELPPPSDAPPLVGPPSPAPRGPAPRTSLPPEAPRPVAPRTRPQRLPRSPAARPSPPLRATRPARREVPALAWLGAALLAAGLPLGAVVTLRRSHSRRRHPVTSGLRG